MLKLKPLLDDVLQEITPQKKPKEVDEFIKKLNRRLQTRKVNAKAMLGGSFAKNVWLKGDHDVDIFVMFNLSYKDRNLSDILEKVLQPWKPERLHGSRDYFNITNKIRYEIVPVLHIRNAQQAQNVTDFSPGHVRWVKKRGKQYVGDIRLLKKFCKAQRVYGAESYITGFSGHVLDVLVIHYKGFVNVLKAATKWKAKQVIDPEKHYRGKNPWLIINKSKLQSPILIVDPLLPERNAAAALSKGTMKKFVKAAQSFLKQPSKDFFAAKKVDMDKLVKKGVVVEMTPLKGKEDVVGAKMMKAAAHITKALQPFAIKESDWVWDRKGSAIFWWQVKKKSISPLFDLPGPPVKMKQHVKAFKKKHRKTFVKKGKVYAPVKRKANTAEKAVGLACKDRYVQERTRRCSRK